MKRFILFTFSILLNFYFSFAQDGINYQGAATDANGDELTNQNISIRASVLSTTANGNLEWEETHSATTDQFGLFNVVIGQGTNTTNGATATFDDMDWGSADHYLKIEMDATGGTNYAMIGTTQMMSVPYALYAKSAGIDSTMLANMIGSSGGGMGGGCDYKFPDGIGQSIAWDLSNGNDYTVPAGKNLFITNVHSNDGSSFRIDGIKVIDELYGVRNASYNDEVGMLRLPLCASAGEVISASSNSTYTETFYGILTDAIVEPISFPFSNNSYLVPSGKRLIITNLWMYGNSNNNLTIDGVIIAAESFNKPESNGNKYLHIPLIVNSGSVISVPTSFASFNGYLADENYFAGCGGEGSSSSASGLDSAMVAGMIANSGGGSSFGDWELIYEDLVLPGNMNTVNIKWGQASKDGFLYLMDKNGSLGTIYTWTDENILDTIPGNGTLMSKKHDFRRANTGYYETKLIPIKENSYWVMQIPGNHPLDLYFIPLESGGGSSSSASNTTIDSLSQLVSILDSSLTALTSQINFGCTDATACNYDATANLNDGSCTGILGCTDATATNYNSSATCDDGSCTALAIGDTYHGGIVFYLDGIGGGLTAAIGDQSSGAAWGCYGTIITGADGTAIGTGNQNTIDMEAECTTSGIAADLCANLILSGYNDWFLPSRDELELMYINLHSQGLGSFLPDYYWSSSEWGPNDSWYVNFADGTVSYLHPPIYKQSNIGVRAIRTF